MLCNLLHGGPFISTPLLEISAQTERIVTVFYSQSKERSAEMPKCRYIGQALLVGQIRTMRMTQNGQLRVIVSSFSLQHLTTIFWY